MHSASGRTHATTITTHVPLAYLPQSGTLGTESSTDAGMCCVVCGACWLHMVHMRVPGVNSVVGKAVGMHMRTHTRTHTRTHAHSHAHTHAHAKSPSEVLVNDRGTRTDRAGLAEQERCRVGGGMGFKRPSHRVSIPVTNPLLLQEPSRQCKGVERCVVCVLGWDILGYGGGRGGWSGEWENGALWNPKRASARTSPIAIDLPLSTRTNDRLACK